MASTPDQEGDVTWKAIQKYDDGSTVRWIGATGSDNPAAVTKVSKTAPKENAGGEGEEASDPAASVTATAAATTAAAPAPAAAADPEDDDGDSPLPLILSIAAVVLAGAALVKAFR